MSNVVDMTGRDISDALAADDTLQDAKGKLETVVVIGVARNGKNYIQSNTADVATINLILDYAKRDLFNMAEHGE